MRARVENLRDQSKTHWHADAFEEQAIPNKPMHNKLVSNVLLCSVRCGCMLYALYALVCILIGGGGSYIFAVRAGPAMALMAIGSRTRCVRKYDKIYRYLRCLRMAWAYRVKKTRLPANSRLARVRA